jgi:branched-subunit amino acid aminotransferase/4-amino-4-deoxychorismate lyase
VRVQASRDGAGALHVCAVPRELGPEPTTWQACVAPFPHEGRMPWSGAKVTNHLLFALAADHARVARAEEALLFDRDGYLVEGSRSNLVVVGEDGVPVAPDPTRGGVAGVGLEVLREREREIRVRHVSQSELARARELIAVNAIRGPRPVVALDGRAVGTGEPGPWARRLAQLFETD